MDERCDCTGTDREACPNPPRWWMTGRYIRPHQACDHHRAEWERITAEWGHKAEFEPLPERTLAG